MTTRVNTVNVSDAIVQTTLTLVKRNSNKWTGTMTDLRASLTKLLGRELPESWPGSPSALRVVLNRTLSRIRNRGVSVKFTRAPDRNRTRLVQLSTK